MTLKKIGSIHASIAGDFRYGSSIGVFYDSEKDAVVIKSSDSSPVGGMDSFTPSEEHSTNSYTIDNPTGKSIVSFLKGKFMSSKKDRRQAGNSWDTIRVYGKPSKKFSWYTSDSYSGEQGLTPILAQRALDYAKSIKEQRKMLAFAKEEKDNQAIWSCLEYYATNPRFSELRDYESSHNNSWLIKQAKDYMSSKDYIEFLKCCPNQYKKVNEQRRGDRVNTSERSNSSKYKEEETVASLKRRMKNASLNELQKELKKQLNWCDFYEELGADLPYIESKRKVSMLQDLISSRKVNEQKIIRNIVKEVFGHSQPVYVEWDVDSVDPTGTENVGEMPPNKIELPGSVYEKIESDSIKKFGYEPETKDEEIEENKFFYEQIKIWLEYEYGWLVKKWQWVPFKESVIRESEIGDYSRDDRLLPKSNENKYIVLWAGENRGYITRVATGWKLAADQHYNRYPVIVYRKYVAKDDEEALSVGKSLMKDSPYQLMYFEYGSDENYSKGGFYIVHNITTNKVLFNGLYENTDSYMFDGLPCNNRNLKVMGVKL